MFDRLLREIWMACGGDEAPLSRAHMTGEGSLPSVFATSDLAAASVAAAGLAVSELIEAGGAKAPGVTVDRRLASLWFGSSISPAGWKPPPVWDPIAGDYATRDGWIRLHTNAPHHRAAALSALGCAPERAAVAACVRDWNGDDLETAVVAAGGCAAAMRSLAAWRAHEQGRAVAAEPLAIRERFPAPAVSCAKNPARPLAGVRVLDLTRILAGPVATRFLAGYGAEVLRIDPPDWDEPVAAPEVALGKICARLDLASEAGRAQFRALLSGADVLVHGYRSDALERLGLGADARRAIKPDLIDVSLDAFGWSGPWRTRRGFDSLVQMSSGIAEAGMVAAASQTPLPLPVQALDHATGYLMAALALRGLTLRARGGGGLRARVSLARMSALLAQYPVEGGLALGIAPAAPDDYDPAIEQAGAGPLRRMRPPLALDGAPMRWSLPAPALGSSPAEWGQL